METPFDPNNPSAQPAGDDGDKTLPKANKQAGESADANEATPAPFSEDDMPTIRVSPARTPQPEAVTPIADAEAPVAGAGEVVSSETAGVVATPAYEPPPPPPAPSYAPPPPSAPAFNPTNFADAATTTAEQQPYTPPPPPPPAPSWADAATVAPAQAEAPAVTSSTEDTIASEDTIPASPAGQPEQEVTPLIEHVPAQSSPGYPTPPAYEMAPPPAPYAPQSFPSPDYQIPLSPEAASAPMPPTPAQGFQAPPPPPTYSQPGAAYPPSGQFAPPPPTPQAYPPSGQFAAPPMPSQAPQSPYPPSGQFAAPPPQPGQYMAAPMVVAPVIVQQNNNKTLAIILEIVGGLFGIFGIGWLVAGKTKVGIPLLIGGIIWGLIEIVGSILTIGLGLLCFFPIDIIALIVSTIMLNNSFSGQPMSLGFGATPVAPAPPYQQYPQAPQYPQTPPAQPYQSAPQYPQNPQPPQYPQ